MAPSALRLALIFCLLVAPAPAAAIDPIPGTAVPAEPEAVFLPDPVTDAITFDLDGDGTNELVLVTASDIDPGLAAVQAWYVADAEMGVSAAGHGNAVPLRRSASGDELLSGVGRARIDSDGMIAVELDDPARLLRAHRDGREILLVATIGTDAQFDGPCCLTIWEVVDTDRSLELRLVAATQRHADQLIAADMDADGTDEMLVVEGRLDSAPQQLDLSLLSWNGVSFEWTSFTIPDVSACCAALLDSGETDGVPGAEVLLVGPLIGPGLSQPTGLHRVSRRAGAPFVERADLGDVIAAHALSLETGTAVLTSDGSILFLWSWSRDGQPERQAGRTSGGAPSTVFGTGADTRILAGVAFQDPGSVLVLPGDLGGGAGPSTVFGRDTRPGAFAATVQGEAATSLSPFFGVVPGGLPEDRDAYVFGGRLVRPASDSDVLGEVASLALLPGLEPLGTVGPGGEWVALLTEFSGFHPLQIRPPAVLLSAVSPRTVRLVATSSLLEPEVSGGHLAPTFLGVARDPDHPTGLIVGNEAAYAEISGPPGTTVWWSTRGRPFGELTLGAEEVARIQLLEPAGPNAPDGSGATASVWLVTPAGHAYYGTWRIRVYRQPPSVTIAPNDALFNFSPTVAGQTVPGATVTINGHLVEVTEDGSFEGSVDAGILPTEVRVVAVDPVGNRSERVVSVVWPLDYRRLPFVPMAVLLTIGAAVILFRVRPDTGPSRRTPDDGATFEEIGG